MEDACEKQSFHRMSSQRRRKLWSLAARAAAKCSDEVERQVPGYISSTPPAGWSRDSLVRTQDSGVSVDIQNDGLQFKGVGGSFGSIIPQRASFDVKWLRSDQKAALFSRPEITSSYVAPRRFYSAQPQLQTQTTVVDQMCAGGGHCGEDLIDREQQFMGYGDLAFGGMRHDRTQRRILNPTRRFPGGRNPSIVVGSGSADSSGLGSSLDWASIDVGQQPMRQFSTAQLSNLRSFQVPVSTRSFDETLVSRLPSNWQLPAHSNRNYRVGSRMMMDRPSSGSIRPTFACSLDHSPIPRRCRYPSQPQVMAHDEIDSSVQLLTADADDSMTLTRSPNVNSRSFDQSQLVHPSPESAGLWSTYHPLIPGPSLGPTSLTRFAPSQCGPLEDGQYPRRSYMDHFQSTHEASVHAMPPTEDQTIQNAPYLDVPDHGFWIESSNTNIPTEASPIRMFPRRARTLDESRSAGQSGVPSPQSRGRRQTLVMHPIPPPTDDYSRVMNYTPSAPPLQYGTRSAGGWFATKSDRRFPGGPPRTGRPFSAGSGLGWRGSFTGLSQRYPYSQERDDMILEALDEERVRGGSGRANSSSRNYASMPGLQTSMYDQTDVDEVAGQLSPYPNPCLKSIQQYQISQTAGASTSDTPIQPGRKRPFDDTEAPQSSSRLINNASYSSSVSQTLYTSTEPTSLTTKTDQTIAEQSQQPRKQISVRSCDSSVKSNSNDRPLIHPKYVQEPHPTSPEEIEPCSGDIGERVSPGATGKSHVAPRPMRSALKIRTRSTSHESDETTSEKQPYSHTRRITIDDRSDIIPEIMRLNSSTRTPLLKPIPYEDDSLTRKSSNLDDLSMISKYPTGITGQRQAPTNISTLKTILPGDHQAKTSVNLTAPEVEDFAEYWDHSVFAKARIGAVVLAGVAFVCKLCTLGANTWIYQGIAGNWTYSGFWKRCSSFDHTCEYTLPFITERAGWQDGALCILIMAILLGMLSIGLVVAGHVVDALAKRLYYFHSGGEAHVVAAFVTALAILIFHVTTRIHRPTSPGPIHLGAAYGVTWFACALHLIAALLLFLDELLHRLAVLSTRVRCIRICMDRLIRFYAGLRERQTRRRIESQRKKLIDQMDSGQTTNSTHTTNSTKRLDKRSAQL